MIKIENVDVCGFETAIRGMRNPMNSWHKSDSDKMCIGENDLKLMKKLAKAGTDHSKFLRMINVSMDIVAPLYWVAEHDTYKVGTVRNSCSFMHKGTSKPFDINDFSIQDNRVYYLLNPIQKEQFELIYPYETDEFRIYELSNGRQYKVFRNGKVVSCEFSYTDNYGTGRTRVFKERECIPSKTNNGYFELNLGGRSGEKWSLHRLVASVWKNNDDNCETVNHINGNKGDNSAENLEWCTLSDNIKDGFFKGLYDKNKLHFAYISWKNGHCVVQPEVKRKIIFDYNKGLGANKISEKYDLPKRTVNNIIYIQPCENNELFYYTYMWEKLIDQLNQLRELYLETNDDDVFKEIRQLLPQGYNIRYTWQGNYQVLLNMYHSRRNHKLDEWVEFCKWIEGLPYFKEICLEGINE